ncbi:MAG: hypothetical protein EXR27_10295 [Betaproteobacteria bacterium]|nr:hypothetical protein [Betaproteobacteria bacterium]
MPMHRNVPLLLACTVFAGAVQAQELVASAAGRPGRMNYASGGIGTSVHLAGATLVAQAKLDAVHIPMRGSVEIAAALLRGDVQFAFPIAGTAIPNVRSGKLRALAVTSPARLPQFPDVPTMAEIMHNDIFVQESWFGAWAPAGTPQPVLQKLHAALAKAMQGPGLRQLLEASGSYAATSKSPGEYAAYVKSEHAKWGEIVKLSGAKAE